MLRHAHGDAACGDSKRQPDGPEVPEPIGGKRWWPVPKAPICQETKKETRRVGLRYRPEANVMATMQLPFSPHLPSGARCPLSMLGECGDEACVTFRPKHPKIRAAIEERVVLKCVEYFQSKGRLDTYVSIGCGLLAQDWILLEKLREANVSPCRAVFVDLRLAIPIIELEGHAGLLEGQAPGRLDLHQTGVDRCLGPEFSFFARVDPHIFTRPAILFDFCNGAGNDAIFVEVIGPEYPGSLTFSVIGENTTSVQFDLLVGLDGCYESFDFLCTISALGTIKAYINGQLLAQDFGDPPKPIIREHMYVGGAFDTDESNFQGTIRGIKIWDVEVDWFTATGFLKSEMALATNQLTHWYRDEVAVWTFGSLASYKEAAIRDPRFAADLLLRVDVHVDIEGYETFCCDALSKHGLALTLGGPGGSWSRSGGGFLPVTDTRVEILEKAELQSRIPPCEVNASGDAFIRYASANICCLAAYRWSGRRGREIQQRRKSRRKKARARHLEQKHAPATRQIDLRKDGKVQAIEGCETSDEWKFKFDKKSLEDSSRSAFNQDQKMKLFLENLRKKQQGRFSTLVANITESAAVPKCTDPVDSAEDDDDDSLPPLDPVTDIEYF